MEEILDAVDKLVFEFYMKHTGVPSWAVEQLANQIVKTVLQGLDTQFAGTEKGYGQN